MEREEVKKFLVSCVVFGGIFYAIANSVPAQSYGGINYALMSNIVSGVPAEEGQLNPNLTSVTINDPTQIGVVDVNLSSEDHAQGIVFETALDVVNGLMKAGQNPTKVNFGFCVFASMPVTTLTGQAAVHPIGHSCYDPYTDNITTWTSDETD